MIEGGPAAASCFGPLADHPFSLCSDLKRFVGLGALFDQCVDQTVDLEIWRVEHMDYGLVAGCDIEKGDIVLVEKVCPMLPPVDPPTRTLERW